MLFNSLDFAIFFPILLTLYWFVFNKSLKSQNTLILISSYIFYGWWDYRFLGLIILSTFVDYFIGLKVYTSTSVSHKKLFLWLSIIFNLSVLCVFKYYSFFVESFIDFFNFFGYNLKNSWTVKIILPVGISFYTFQTMSYTIDIYRKNLIPTKNFISFASFVSFFPQLVAGPIERASNLLPQILKERKFDYNQAVQGLRLILWGMFKKVVIADSLAPTVNQIFENYQTLNSTTLLLGAVYFSFQIYCDFSGYSDIAIGTSKVLGFELMSNFKTPYFSRNIGEFWRRWHISLSTWFRDYLYFPLGGSKFSKLKSLRNIFIIFLVSGFWHGANWTFIFWGLIHAMLYIPSFLFKTNRNYVSAIVAENKYFPTLKEIYQMATNYFFVTIAWVFFRSTTINEAFNYIIRMFSFDFNTNEKELDSFSPLYLNLTLVGFIILEWLIRNNERDIYSFLKDKHNIRYTSYLIMSIIIIYKFLLNDKASFIYFQF
ncbi:MBOAT family O-acyltransferase [Maribacter dokdonensis]|nr:MBOAT family O-acyltransferase [Maribacter dokdonensis]MDP2527924.1 MBOAT family O-acyltransferase [Maribacter dokdonensis]